MDNNYQTEFYTPLIKNAAFYRARARDMLRDNYGIALLAAFLAMILGGAAFGGIATSGSLEVNSEDLEMLKSPDFWHYVDKYLPFLIGAVTVSALTSVAFTLFVSSPVALGYQRFNLALCDRDTGRLNVSTLFSYFTSPSYMKSVLLNLLQSLITLAAALPAIAGAVASMILTYLIPALFPLWLLLLLGGALLSAAIALPIFYSLSYSFMIMAEYPSVTPSEAIRNSRSLMRGNKWRLFCLDFSFIGWILLAVLTLGIGFIFLTPYMQAARVAFYHDVANREAAKETEFPSLDPDDYNEDSAPM